MVLVYFSLFDHAKGDKKGIVFVSGFIPAFKFDRFASDVNA